MEAQVCQPGKFAKILAGSQTKRAIQVASDIDTYVNWTLNHVHHHGGFVWTAKSSADWNQPWEGWTRTRYEAKAIRESRTPCYLVFIKS